MNLAPVGAFTKADGIAAFAARFPAAPLLFAGDDDTDEDAFRSPLVTYAIRVGRSEATAAPYRLEGQVDVDRLLSELVTERAQVAGWRDLDPP